MPLSVRMSSTSSAITIFSFSRTTSIRSMFLFKGIMHRNTLSLSCRDPKRRSAVSNSPRLNSISAASLMLPRARSNFASQRTAPLLSPALLQAGIAFSKSPFSSSLIASHPHSSGVFSPQKKKHSRLLIKIYLS